MAAYIVKYKAFEEKNFLWQLDEESYPKNLATYIKATGKRRNEDNIMLWQ